MSLPCLEKSPSHLGMRVPQDSLGFLSIEIEKTPSVHTGIYLLKPCLKDNFVLCQCQEDLSQKDKGGFSDSLAILLQGYLKVFRWGNVWSNRWYPNVIVSWCVHHPSPELWRDETVRSWASLEKGVPEKASQQILRNYVLCAGTYANSQGYGISNACGVFTKCHKLPFNVMKVACAE
jgi:hypothetical protein